MVLSVAPTVALSYRVVHNEMERMQKEAVFA